MPQSPLSSLKSPVFEDGNYIGDLAMGYLGPYEEVTAHKPDGGLDLAEMIRRTSTWDCNVMIHTTHQKLEKNQNLSDFFIVFDNTYP